MKLSELAEKLQQPQHEPSQRPPQDPGKKQGGVVPLRTQTAAELEALEIYQEYTRNRMKSGELQAEIMKGLQAAEPLAKLFLQAMEAISLMTGEEHTRKQTAEYLEGVYGIALQDLEAAEISAQSVLERLQKLEQAASLEPDNSGIQAAIKRHRAILERLGQ